MAGLWSAIYIMMLCIIGLAVASAILGGVQRTLVEWAGLIIVLGFGTGCGTLLLLSLLGIAPGRVVIFTLAAIALAAIIFLWKRARLIRFILPRFDKNRHTLLLIPGLLILLAGIFVTIVVAISFPIFNWDSIVIWGFKAKVLYYEPLTPRPWYFSEYRYSYSHLDYPLLMPMMLAGAYSMIHAIHEPAARAVLPAMYIGQILLFYSGARLVLGRLGSLYLTTIVLCAPFTIQQASMGSADMPLGTFCTGAAVYLLRWSIYRQRTDAILVGLFTLFAALTKAEGLPLAIITALLIAAVAASWRSQRAAIDVAMVIAILAAGLSIWLGWRAGIPHTDENYVGHTKFSVIASNLPRLGTILKNLFVFGVKPKTFGLLWILIPVCAAMGYRAFRWPQTWIMWTLFLAHLCTYVFAYLITPWNLQELINNSLNRLFLHLATTGGLIIALHLAAMERSDLGTSDSPSEFSSNQIASAPLADILPLRSNPNEIADPSIS